MFDFQKGQFNKRAKKKTKYKFFHHMDASNLLYRSYEDNKGKYEHPNKQSSGSALLPSEKQPLCGCRPFNQQHFIS